MQVSEPDAARPDPRRVRPQPTEALHHLTAAVARSPASLSQHSGALGPALDPVRALCPRPTAAWVIAPLTGRHLIRTAPPAVVLALVLLEAVLWLASV